MLSTWEADTAKGVALIKTPLCQPHLTPALLFVYQTSRNTSQRVYQQTGIKQFSCLAVPLKKNPNPPLKSHYPLNDLA